MLEIKETHCLACNSRLVKNGHNNRLVILDQGSGTLRFRIQRKRCSRCGEIYPDLSQLVPRFANYHENYKKRARQHYLEGLMPSQIKRVFQIDFGVNISKTTIVNWINEVAEPLRDTLKKTPIPSSGYWGYDELHMRISGKRMYTLDTVDIITKFVPAARVYDSMGRQAGLHLFKEARRLKSEKIVSIVKDCTANLGGLFKTRSFKHIIQQNCLTHVKWMISKHVKAFAGLSIRSSKPIPRRWNWLLMRFYNVIDSKNETDAYISLEVLRCIVEGLTDNRIKHLTTALKNLEAWLPKIIPHQQNPYIPNTNNLLESYHKKYTYYPSFKRNMMTAEGAQRVLDYRVFRHNYGRFPAYIAEIEAMYNESQVLVKETKNHPTLRGSGRHFTSHLAAITKWYDAYQQLWNQYFITN